MKKNRLWTCIGISILILTWVFALPFADPCEAAKGKKDRLVLAWSESPQAGLNPFLMRNEGDYLFLSLLYEPLVLAPLSGNMIPWLAVKWEYKDADKAWYIYLDKRAKWSDGKALTAEDVKSTFDIAFKYEFPIGTRLKAFVESVEVVDAHTVKFSMKKPQAGFIFAIANARIMPKHIFGKIEKVDEFRNEDPIGSGPYTLKMYKERAFGHFVANPNYWKGPVPVKEYVIKVITNQEAQVVAMKKGEVDLLPNLSGSEALLPPLKEDPNVEVYENRKSHIWYMAPNYRKHPLGVKAFRKAVDIAINKESIIKDAALGYAEPPLMGYIAPIVDGWADPTLTWKGMGRSEADRVAEANAMLDKLGYKKGADGIRVDDKGNQIEFLLRCMSVSATYIRASENIMKTFKKLGIKSRLETSDPQTLYGGIVYSGKRPNDWDLLVHGSFMDSDPDHFAREYAPDPPNSWDNAPAFGWTHAELQPLLQASRIEMDPKKRWNMIQKAQKMFADEVVVFTLGHKTGSLAYRTDKYTGWTDDKELITLNNAIALPYVLLTLKPVK